MTDETRVTDTEQRLEARSGGIATEPRGPARRLARWIARRYYPRMEIVGAERIPQTGPVLLCANHSNSLLDAVIVGITARRPVRFMAKATLFDQPIFGSLLRSLGMLPAYRGMDDTRQVRRNLESLDAGAQILIDGQAMGIFPEGMSSDRAHLEKVRTGAARMALQALEGGAEEVQIVPIGICYERKEAFRSGVLVRVGKAIHVADILADCEGSVPKARRAVTQLLEAHLKEVAVHLEEPEWQPWLEDLEALVPATAKGVPEEPLWRRKHIADAINYYLEHDRPRAESVGKEIFTYRNDVKSARLRVDSPVLQTSRWVIALKLLWRAIWLIFLFVPALFGTLFHILPFVLVRVLASWMDQPGRVTTATHRLMVGVPVYVVWYVAVTAGLLLYGPRWSWALPLVAPFAGIISLLYWREARNAAFLLYHEIRVVIGRHRLRMLRQQLSQLSERLLRLSAQPAERKTPEIVRGLRGGARTRGTQEGSRVMSRRLLMMIVVIFFLGLPQGCSPTAPAGAPEGVTIYEFSSYQGQSRRLDADVQDFDNVSGPCFGDWDDCISSIRVPAGWQAILYEDPNYRGPSLTVTSDIRDLETEHVDGWNSCDGRWDDCASSIRVTRLQ